MTESASQLGPGQNKMFVKQNGIQRKQFTDDQ